MDGYFVSVQAGTHAAEARRAAMDLASRLSFDTAEAGNLGLVVTEAAKNLLKHAGGGEVVLRPVAHGDSVGVEMLAIDKGPGIDNVSHSFQDGYSTAGTSGTGLGAISRLSSYYDIYSRPNQGTVLMAQVRKRPVPRADNLKPPSKFRLGAVSVPKTGEVVCGDAWILVEHADGVRLLVADGLGHGLLASDASSAAVRVAQEQVTEGGPRLMDRIHGALRPTRGAAVAVAELEHGRGILRFTGIGNIGGSIRNHGGAVQHLVSHSGTAGHEVRKITEFSYRWDPASLLVMHSDGLSSHWSLDRYPGLSSRHPSVIAGVLYRDFSRGRDDATVVVLQEATSHSHEAVQ